MKWKSERAAFISFHFCRCVRAFSRWE